MEGTCITIQIQNTWDMEELTCTLYTEDMCRKYHPQISIEKDCPSAWVFGILYTVQCTMYNVHVYWKLIIMIIIGANTCY